MFCHKCGYKAVEGASFCEKCGTKLINNGSSITNIENIPNVKSENLQQYEDFTANCYHSYKKMSCPKCNSQDVYPISETETKIKGGGYGIGKGICGWLILGPIGLLCGACGSKPKFDSKTRIFWICKNCKNKFRSTEDIEEEQEQDGLASIMGLFPGSLILYIAGNLFRENEIDFLGLPSWIYITLGVIGLILVSLAVLYYAVKEIEKSEKKGMYTMGIFITSVCILVLGIIFAIIGVSFFWIPAWIFIVLGLLCSIISGFARFLIWGYEATDEEMEKFCNKYGSKFEKIKNWFSKK